MNAKCVAKSKKKANDSKVDRLYFERSRTAKSIIVFSRKNVRHQEKESPKNARSKDQHLTLMFRCISIAFNDLECVLAKEDKKCVQIKN